VVQEVVRRDVTVIMIVDNVVFIFLDDLHCRQNVERVVNSSLDVFKVYFLTYLAKFLVDFEDLICDLSSSHHWLVSHFLQH